VFTKAMNKRTRAFHSRRWLNFAAAAAIATIFCAPASLGQSEGAQVSNVAAGNDRITVKLDDPSKPGTVRASLLAGSISVEGYDGKEIIIEGHHLESPPEYDGDMKRYTHSGFSVQQQNNQVQIISDLFENPMNLMLKVPYHTSLSLRTVTGGDIEVNGVDGEFDISNVNGSVRLNNVSGSAAANAVNGQIVATFAHVNPDKPMAFSSMNGNIDVTFPTNLKADIRFHTFHGDFYSNFDLQFPANEAQSPGDGWGFGDRSRFTMGKAMHGTIGGGGPEIQFTNFNGNIYVRKAKSTR
jgi:Putative adhesin